MKIKFLKDHSYFKAGEEVNTENDVRITDGVATYLIKLGAAEEVVYQEKAEKSPRLKEKAENKTGNVPTAKSMKAKKK